MDKEQILDLAMSVKLHKGGDAVEAFYHAAIESYKAELLKEAGEPVAKVVSSGAFEVPCLRWTSENASLETLIGTELFTSDQVAAAIIKATKPLEEQLASAQGEIERLKAEANHRYVEQVLSPIRRLLTVARAAWSAADNGLGVLVDDGIELRVSPADFDKLSDALGLLDMLPDDKPGFTLNGPARAEWALRDLIGDTNEAIN